MPAPAVKMVSRPVGNRSGATLLRMRWDRLFADLETQLEAAADGALDTQVADRTRHELAATSMEGRLRAATGRILELSVAGAGSLVGEVRRVGAGWLLLAVAGGPPALLATGAVVAVRDLPVATRERGVAEQAAIVQVLRVLSRDRTVTAVTLRDGNTLTGTIDRVGADYVDLAEHPLDEARRGSCIRGVRTVALAAVAMLRPRLE